jgi:hypothetical protein
MAQSTKKTFSTTQTGTVLASGASDLLLWNMLVCTDGSATVKNGSEILLIVDGGEAGGSFNRPFGAGDLTIDCTGNTQVYLLSSDVVAA